MKKRLLLALTAVLAFLPGVMAQRTTDALGRGLVAVKTTNGVLCTWRINADEWYGTEYNVYRGSTKLNTTPLKVSNYVDAGGTTASTYTVKAVVNGVETDASAPAKVWEKNYTIIKPKHAAEITGALVPNDATAADVDGDGELEILMKYDQSGGTFAGGNNGIYTVIECLELDGTVKWWINFGPNIGDFQNNEINIIGTDWDGDGRAEVVFRAADGTVIHHPDGTTYTVGDASINYRSGDSWPDGQWFMHWGKEYLIYADGLTCKPYECIDYPLVRVPAENNPNGLLSGGAYDTLVNNEWGDGYGHRSSKYFFASPYLDGRKPSLFLSRGIYTKIKMITYDIDPATHHLVERWRWSDNGWPWHGQGYHNMGIADVDWDGRDEIVYGSMVIDDNGQGLSTTGLGHGDAQHCGDFDPYTHGQEIFACNEDSPNNNFRDATTSKIYYRTTGGNDDGRSNMGNFIDEYPGGEGLSSRDNALVGGASHKALVGDSKSTVSITQNFRVYWDGDLCDESFDYSNGKNTAGAIYKAKAGRIALLEGSKTNNDTKGTPCYQGDILGDWREEYIMRDADNNIRIYTTDFPTEHRIYSLWYDHQYRNAMNWQMCGYNQPPHVSFALSVFEDITVPPAPLTMTGRTEVANNGTIGAALNGKHVVVCETNDMTLTAGAGVAPAILTVNTPTWTQGHNDNNNITSQSYTHTIGEGTFVGSMRLVKQGDGKLVLPAGTHSYSGSTDIWAGTIAVDGELTNTNVWMNRFAVLETSNLNVPKSIDMNYASVLRLGSKTAAGSISTGDLTLGFGAIAELDVFADGTIDKINAGKLTVETKDWTNGPEYLQPIFRLTEHPAAGENFLPSGRYLIGEVGAVNGKLGDIVLLGIDDMKKALVYEDGKLYLELSGYTAGNKVWVGGDDAIWNLDDNMAFKNSANGENDVFVPGDAVTFDDSALSTDVVVSGRVKPASVTFSNNTKNFTLGGDGQIVGTTKLTKEGAGTLTVNNINSYTGGTYINGGKLVTGVLANKIGNDLGALSDVDSRIYIKNGATFSVNTTGTMAQRITVTSGNAYVEVPDGITLTATTGIAGGSIGQSIVKSGNGTLNLATGNTVSRLVIEGGYVNSSEDGSTISLPGTVEFVKGTLSDPATMYTYSKNPANFYVGAGNSGTLYVDNRCDYTGKLTGEGTFTVYATGSRNTFQGDWSGFQGELVVGMYQKGSYGPDFTWSNSYGMPKATLNIPANVTFNGGGYNISLGNLKGAGTFNATGTVTVGNDNSAISYTGTFTGKPKVVKTGKCDWKFTKLLTGITSLDARDGYISLSASSSPYKTVYLEAPLIINGSSTLRGRGSVADITVSGNGTIEPGTYSDSNPYHYGPIYSTGNVTVNPGATLALYLRVAGKSNDCSYISVDGTLKIDGNVKVTMNDAYTPAIGDQFQLWTAGKFSGNPAIELPELPAGLEWDFAGLKDNTGILKVVASSAIAEIGATTVVECRVYDLAGMYLGSLETCMENAAADIKSNFNLSAGIYILKLQAGGISETMKVRL